MATGGDYRSKGIHTNRDKTAKMRVSPVFRDRERTVMDNAGDIVAQGNRRLNEVADTINPPKPAKQMGPTKERAAALDEANRAARRKQVAGAVAQAGADSAAQMQADQERFSREHDAAVQEGSAMMARNQQSTPGKAQEIIRKRRI